MVNTAKLYILGDKDHIYITFITLYIYNSSFIKNVTNTLLSNL